MNIFKKKFIFLLPALAFLLWPSIRAEAQSPGGVGLSNVELWLKADATITEGGGKVTLWEDKSGKGRNFGNTWSSVTIPPANLPTYNQTSFLMNFWPSVDFRGSNSMRLIGPNFVPTVNTSRSAYYVFYVSERDAATATGHGGVYGLNAANNDTRYNFVGWNGAQPFFNLTGLNLANNHQGNGKLYGVNVAILPNSSTVAPQSYLNGIVNSTSFTARELNQSAAVLGAIGGASNNLGQGTFKGNVQEIIVLSGPQHSELPYNDLQKISSYLSLKYGIALEAGNYVNSSGTEIWNRTTNNGYNQHIFGLGRDDNSDLQVKQSTTYGVASLLTAYVGTLTTLNSQNTGPLNNNVFVLFGSNGATEREKYQAQIVQGFVTNVFEYRLTTAHKVQLTGASTLALNLKVNRAASSYAFDRILVSSRSDFDPAATQAYSIGTGDVANITLRNGDYISFGQTQKFPTAEELNGLAVKIYATAEDPDVSPILHGQPVGSWVSALLKQGSTSWAGYPNHGGSDAARPTMNKQDSLMNFRPSIRFAANQSLFAPSNYSNLDLPGQYLPMHPDSMYYLFYVSKSNNLSGGRSVIYHRGNQFGWKDGTPAYNTAGGDLGTTTTQAYRLSDPTKKGFGITGLIHPNIRTIPVTFYFNGEWQQMPAGNIRTDRTNLIVGGTTNSQFTGDIQEMAVFATPNTNNAQPLSIGIIRIINSTLAVKYGITLTEGDYVLPDTILPMPPILPNGSLGQTAVWSRSKAVHNATGKKYDQTIFGIGRSADIKGLSVMSILGIHQKQARPYTPNNLNGSPFAVYVGNSLTGLNSENTGTVPKGVFLMFGADEELTTPTRGWENSYLQNTQFDNAVLQEDVDARTAVFKAQLSTSPLVNNPPLSSLSVKFQKMLNFTPNSYLLVSQSPEFVPANTKLYTFNSSGTTGDIAIKDGDYVTIVTQSKYDQGPGGVEDGLRFWMHAEPNFLTKDADNKVREWRDAAGVVPDLKYNNVGTRPLPVYKEFDPHSNYHPAVVFNEGVENTTGGAILASPKGMMSVQAPPVFTFFSVFNNDFTYNTLESDGIRAYPIGFGNYSQIDAEASENRYPAFGVQSNANKTAGLGRFVDKSNGNFNYNQYNGNLTLFRPRATMIMVHEVEKGKRIRYEFDAYGEDVTTGNTLMGRDFQMSNSQNVIGGGSFKGRYLHGPLSEIFAYERQLTQSEKNSIYSYLGLKYGITIDLNKSDESINFNYVLSNGTPVWPGNQPDHQKYHNRVAALVRDDAASLFNKRARSTGDEAVLFMGMQDNNGNWTDFAQNRSTIAWGSTAMAVDSAIFVRDIPTICGDIDERMRRVWLVDNFDQNKTEVIIRIGTPYLGKYGVQGAYQAFMLVADSEDKLKAGSGYPYDDATHNWDEVVPGQLVLTDEGYEHEFRYRFQGKLTYLTFGFKALGGACPTCGFDGTKTLAFNSSTWNSSANTTIGGALDLGGNFRTLASVTKNQPATGLTTQVANNSLRINRNGNPTGTITTSIQLQDTAAATSFEVYDIGGGANAYDRVEIVGICGGQETYPKLYYMTNETNSTYTIRLNVATGKRNRPSSYTSENSRLRVVFPFPVREVQVRYTMPGSTANTTGTIGVGPVSYTCPPTLPPLNEAMLAFVQSVSKNPLQFCSDFRYRFTVTNGNCSPKYVNLIDTLPANLQVDTLRLGDAYEAGVTTIDMSGRYNGRQIVKINKLNLKSGNSILDIVIGFIIPGATAGNYTNTATFEYEYTWMNETRNGKAWTSATARVEGSPSDLNWKLLSWEFGSDFECYRDDAEYTYKLKIKNPNYNTYPSIDYGMITFTVTSQDLRALSGHSDSIQFVNDSFKFNGTSINISNVTTLDDGLIVTGLGSPNLEVNTLEFKIKTPKRNDLVSKFGITFDFSTDSGDDCVIRLFNRMDGTKNLSPCDGRSGVINNKDTTSKMKR